MKLDSTSENYTAGQLTNPECPTFVLYHASCADGFAAAYVCWLAFGDAATYIPVKYGEPMPNIPNLSRVFIVDFSYSADELRELAVRSKMVQVIDHHKSAVENLAMLFDDGCDHRFFKTFDMEHSGAVLTWMHFFPEEVVPSFLRYVEDRDLWRWEMWKSREFSAGLALEPKEFARWHELVNGGNMPIIDAGMHSLKLIDQTAKLAAARAVERLVGFHCVPVVNCTVFVSETCHEMLELYPEAKFVAAYFDDRKGQRVWSLRSRKDFDVSAVAKSMGGGGHPQAAGFTVNIDAGNALN